MKKILTARHIHKQKHFSSKQVIHGYTWVGTLLNSIHAAKKFQGLESTQSCMETIESKEKKSR